MEEQLDMVMHQRLKPELDLMLRLLDQEYDLTNSISAGDKMDLQLERSLDNQIFMKYQMCSRYEAFKKAIDLCQKRLGEVRQEDKSLLEYVAFLREKTEEYESVTTQLKAEMQIAQKKNEKAEKEVKKIRKEINDAIAKKN